MKINHPYGAKNTSYGKRGITYDINSIPSMTIYDLLSHGNIIAREYGIPAVVNVGPATKIIKTGQTIQVDANCGVVRIIR